MRDGSQLNKRYSKVFITEALETSKQRLTALATRLKRYDREAEAEGMNGLFSTQDPRSQQDPSRLYSQLQRNNSTSGRNRYHKSQVAGERERQTTNNEELDSTSHTHSLKIPLSSYSCLVIIPTGSGLSQCLIIFPLPFQHKQKKSMVCESLE